MANTKIESGTFVVPKNGYKVSEQTAAVIDCLRMLDALYSKISNALDMIYGVEAEEKRMDEKYYPLWHGLDDLLHDDLQTSIVYNLSEFSNSRNEDEVFV